MKEEEEEAEAACEQGLCCYNFSVGVYGEMICVFREGEDQ